MIKIIKINNKDGYCNVCNKVESIDKEKIKYYQIQFLNKLNQGLCVALCERCMNDLNMKLLRKEIEVEE